MCVVFCHTQSLKLLCVHLTTGLAYILKLLDQNSQFDALHWFMSVKRKYYSDRKKQQDGGGGGKANTDEYEKSQQTKSLAMTRINIYERVRVSSFCSKQVSAVKTVLEFL